MAITLAETKAYLQVDHDAEDALIQALLDAAIMYIEDFTGRAINEHIGEYDPHNKPALKPYTIEEIDGKKYYKTSTTDKLPALKPAVFLRVKSQYDGDPRTMREAEEAADRIARLQRRNMWV